MTAASFYTHRHTIALAAIAVLVLFALAASTRPKYEDDEPTAMQRRNRRGE